MPAIISAAIPSKGKNAKNSLDHVIPIDTEMKIMIEWQQKCSPAWG